MMILCASVSIAQVIYPGGGVYSMADVPGLTNELGLTLTNAIKGADTGTSSGAVSKVGREAVIQFPTMPSFLYITTNSIHGTASIDASGTTTVSYCHTFTNIPFITLTPFGTNIAQLLTPVLLDVTHSNVTFVVVSSGAIITNAYRVDWQANDGAGLSWSGTSLEPLGGVTNVYLNNGSQGMNKFYFPVGYGASKWLISDASGYGSWQDKTIANLTDGASVFKKDGTVLPTADFDMNGKQVKNATKVQVTSGAGTGKVLTSDASGYGSWATPSLAGWSAYIASSTVNMNGNALANVGTLTINGAATFNSTETHNGVATFNGTVNAGTVNASGTFTTTGRIRANKTGGSYGDSSLYAAGYARFDGAVDARSTMHTYGISYAHAGLLAWKNPSYYNVAFYTAEEGAHMASAGHVFSGSTAWTASFVPAVEASASPKTGYIMAQNGLFVNSASTLSPVFSVDSSGNVYGAGTLNAGMKAFKIQHPKDENKWFFHASMESPNIELIYRGKTTLVNGNASVNLNTYYGLIPQTLDAMLTNLTVIVYNNAGWTKVRCASVNSSVAFDIESETPCNDTVEWIAIGTRCDAAVADYKIEANK